MIEMLLSGLVGAAVVGILHVLGAEATGRAQRMLDLLIRRAATRLPSSLRADFIDEWSAEAASILAQNRGLPATRAWSALRYCASLLRTGRKIGAALASQLEEHEANPKTETEPTTTARPLQTVESVKRVPDAKLGISYRPLNRFERALGAIGIWRGKALPRDDVFRFWGPKDR